MKHFFRLCLVAAMVFSLALPALSLAQITGTASGGHEAFGFGSKLDQVAQSYNPSSSVPVEERVGNIIAFFLSLLGVVFMLLIIYAGFRWMTAGGDDEQIKKSTATIRAAVIGLVIVVAAYALSVFVIEKLWGGV